MPTVLKELHGYLAFGMQILELVEIPLHVQSVGRDNVGPERRKLQKLKFVRVIHTAVPPSLSVLAGRVAGSIRTWPQMCASPLPCWIVRKKITKP
jgi:hypothetical protein